MKKIFFSLTAIFFLSSYGVILAQSQIVDLGLFKKTTNQSQLDVMLRTTEDVVNGSYSGGIFTVRFPSSYGVTLSAVPNTALYSYAFAGPVGQFEGYDYYRFQFSGSVNTVNWVKGQEYTLVTLQINGKVPSKAKFELVTQNTWAKANNANYYQELNGLEQERIFYFHPIKVSAFYAKALPDQTVQLDWEYESEASLDYAEVEYSADGNGFGLIGVAPANNETDRVTTGYKFVHPTPQPGANFYRIRMVDINGVVEYSQIRAINFDDLDADFSVFPNPTAGPLTLVSRNLGKYASGVQYQLIDNTGKTIRLDRVVDENVVFDLSKIAAGTYYLRLMNDQEQLDKFKIIVAN